MRPDYPDALIPSLNSCLIGPGMHFFGPYGPLRPQVGKLVRTSGLDER